MVASRRPIAVRGPAFSIRLLIGALMILSSAGCGNPPSEQERPTPTSTATDVPAAGVTGTSTTGTSTTAAGATIAGATIAGTTAAGGTRTLDEPWFSDVARESGIDFAHRDPATPRHLIEETMGSGVAWIDFNRDGWPDLLCLQSTADHRLYRNRGAGRFVDATASSGLNSVRAAFGAAVGDYDNDGWDDLVLTHVDGLTLLRNEAGRFVDATASAGLAGANPHWGTSCAWSDLDADGFLDLYVGNYVEIGGADPPVCRDAARGLYFACPPSAYRLTTHRLFWNRGGQRFEDISAAAGVAAAAPAPGLAVVIVDLDDDRRPDIFVANDLFPAYLFRNRTEPGGPPRFDERASLAGCALGPNGASMSGMCAESADVDGSGRPALFVTNFQGQPNVLFRNRGQLRFDESSGPSGLGPPSRDKLGFGAAFLDADLDGLQDLAVANGHVYRAARELLNVSYAQPMQFFRGRGRGQFRDESAKAGPAFMLPRVGRGLARADFDRDGRPDLALSTVGGPTVLLRNNAVPASPWIGLELVGDGRTNNRNAIGAVVRVSRPTSNVAVPVATHFVAGGGSYLSAHERCFTVGLGTAAKNARGSGKDASEDRGADRGGDGETDVVTIKVEDENEDVDNIEAKTEVENKAEVAVEVTWPDGQRRRYAGLRAGRYWRLEQNTAKALLLSP